MGALTILFSLYASTVVAQVQQTAVVTGGGSGIGRALALELAARGVETIIVGRRETVLIEVANSAQAVYKGKTMIRSCTADISTEDGQERVKKCVGEDKSLDYLVHNAAILTLGGLPTMKLDTWRTALGVIVDAPLFLTQALLPNLIKSKSSGGSRVLLVSTGAADMPIPGLGTYCVSQAARKMLWKILSLELIEKNVNVGLCIPGLVDTAMPAVMSKTEGFMLEDFMKTRIESGDVHSAEEVGQWLSVLLDTSGGKGTVNSTVFREREHNIDMPGHELGLNIKLTMEGKMLNRGSSDNAETLDEKAEL